MHDQSVSLPDTVSRWQIGWEMARGLAPGREIRRARYVWLGLPGRAREVVALHADESPESVRELAELVSKSIDPTWLTVPTRRPTDVERDLKDAGLRLFDVHERLMSVNLAGLCDYDTPSDYTTVITGSPPLFRATAHHCRGDVAARGMVAVHGRDAVVHHVETVPVHRRRGLARAIMTMLRRCALEAGADTGLLVASAAGEQLYSTLGWIAQATVVSAATP